MASSCSDHSSSSCGISFVPTTSRCFHGCSTPLRLNPWVVFCSTNNWYGSHSASSEPQIAPTPQSSMSGSAPPPMPVSGVCLLRLVPQRMSVSSKL